MKKEKLSLANVKSVLSRTELKKIMAGSGGSGYLPCQNVNNYCQGPVLDPTFVCCSGLVCALAVTGLYKYTCQPG